MAANDQRGRLKFGEFEFDRTDGELYRGTERVRLQEHPRQILAVLIEHAGEVVPRETLRTRVWKADTFVDFEHGLNTAVRKLRQALGDSAETPAFIETVARRGHRFVAPVTTAPPAEAPSASAAPVTADAHAPEPASSNRPVIVAALSLALVAIITIAAWAGFGKRAATVVDSSSPASPVRVAIMPLRVLAASESPELSYLGVGIADAITSRLANVRQIAPRPTWAVLSHKDADSDPARVMNRLAVQYLLLGTVQPADGRYRVSGAIGRCR